MRGTGAGCASASVRRSSEHAELSARQQGSGWQSAAEVVETYHHPLGSGQAIGSVSDPFGEVHSDGLAFALADGPLQVGLDRELVGAVTDRHE